MCKTDDKTRNYIISLPRTEMSHRSWENLTCENELIIDIRGQKRTQIQQNIILVLKIKPKNSCKNQSENNEILRRCERKMKVVNQKDDKNKPIILRSVVLQLC